MAQHETSQTSVEEFIARWKGSQASERGNSVSFLNELCALLGVAAPNPATKDAARDDYVYERAIFTMFAEDIGLLPPGRFTELLESLRETPAEFRPMMESVWRDMNEGGYSAAMRARLLRFNGGLFESQEALALDGAQLRLLTEASRADWKGVEPAIFGTLLERALDPAERHRLGAHYTPRAYAAMALKRNVH